MTNEWENEVNNSATETVSGYLNRFTLIVGEVNVGKTTRSRDILNGMCAEGLGPRIAIVDLAPVIPPEIAAQRGLAGIGGRLSPASEDAGVLCLSPGLRPPRLTSKTEDEAMAAAMENLVACRKAFAGVAGSGRDILFVNDASMFVQAGGAEEFLARTGAFETVVANGYFGSKLGKGRLSLHERAEMESLIAACGQVVWL